MTSYFIKQGYRCNIDAGVPAAVYACDEHGASVYQVKVYEFARKMILKHKFRSVLDVGCGFGLKLKRIIYPVCTNVVGIDTKHSIDFCKQEHNFGRWLEDDIEKPRLRLSEKFDLIISADVIEHLVDPGKLLSYIKGYSHENTNVVISTPERDAVEGKNGYGPPLNKAHVREWNRCEFGKYMESSGFRIIKHFLVGERGQDLVQILKNVLRLRPLRKNQVVLCRPCG